MLACYAEATPSLWRQRLASSQSGLAAFLVFHHCGARCRRPLSDEATTLTIFSLTNAATLLSGGEMNLFAASARAAIVGGRLFH